MEPVIISQIIIGTSTLLAGLGGYVLAGLNESRRDRRIVEREERTHQARHAEELRDKSHAFQLENLLALQNALQLMARLTGRAMHFDHMQARQNQYTQLPPAWSDEMHKNGVNVNRLTSRVLNDEMRANVEVFTSFTAALSYLPKEFEGLSGDDLEDRAYSKIVEMNHQVASVMSPLGAQIRVALVD